MDIGRPIVEHGPVDIGALRDGLAGVGADFWQLDRPSREGLAGDRPGGAVYYYNDQPHFLPPSLPADGQIPVLRNVSRPLFEVVDRLVTDHVAPAYPGCDVIRVQLANLPAGDTIKPHRDSGILALIHRAHIPIATNDGVSFTIGEEDFTLRGGVLYELNNCVRHSVVNDGDTDRVHLLIDLIPHEHGRAAYYDSAKDMALASLQLSARGAAAMSDGQ